jgi:hypothetical protein
MFRNAASGPPLHGFAGRRLKSALNPDFTLVFDEEEHFLNLGDWERT